MARFVEIVKQYPDQAQVDLCVEIEVPGLWLGGTEMGSINATERSAKYKAQVVEYDDVREFPGPIPSRARPGESVVYWYSILCNLYTQWIHQPKPREERRIPSASYASWTLQSTKILPVIGCSCRDWLRPKLEEIVAAYMRLYGAGKESRDSDNESDGSDGTGGLEEEDGDVLWHVGSCFSAACDASSRLGHSNECSIYVL